ncbi:MAG: MFS transporter [Actinomycetota bacterium]|nr:MFS transporter [Actinomycetota bacterium]
MAKHRFHSADYSGQTGDAGAPIHSGAVEIKALAVLCMTFFLVALDNTIVNVALPTLQRSLGSSTTELQWITDAYTTAFAGLIIVGGHLADRLGRREVLQSGLVAFIIGSVVALSAHSSDVIIVGRLVMGIGAALAVPASLSMLIDVFPTPAQRQTAIAGWTASAGLGVALGPLVGGALLTHFWWGSIFLANMAVAALALVASGLLLPRSPSHRLHSLDWIGSALSVVALSCLVAGIIQAPSWGWADLRTLFLFVVAVVAGLLFVRRAMTAESGIVHFSVFRSRHFSLSSLAMGTIYLGIFGFLFLMTQFLQLYLGYSPLRAGVSFLPAAVAVVAGTGVARALAPQVGPRLSLAVGLVLMIVAIGQELFFTTATTYVGVVGILVTGGLSMGIVLTVGTDEVMGSLAPRETGIGAAINVAAMEIGGALGVALFGSIFNSEYARELKPATAALPVAIRNLADGSLTTGLAVAGHLAGAIQSLLVLQVRLGFMDGFALAGWMGVTAAAAAALCVAAFMPSQSVAAAGEPEPEPA